MSTQEDALQAGAELLAESAKDIGQRCGLHKDLAPVLALEEALAIAWAEIAHWRGANDTPERLNECIRKSSERIGDAIRKHHYLRLGTKPGLLRGR